MISKPTDGKEAEEQAAEAQVRGLWELLMTALWAGVREDERSTFRLALTTALRRPIGRRRAIGLAHSAALQTLLVSQVLTGILVCLLFHPTVDGALASVHAMEASWGGWLLRQFHLWNARALIVLTLWMLARQVIVGAWRRHGRVKWIAAVAFLLVLWTFFATGVALPQDAQGVRATETLASTLHDLPFAGRMFEGFLAFPSAQSPDAFSRAYVAHVVLLPWLMFFLLLVIFSFFARPRHEGKSKHRIGAPLWPHRTLDLMVVSLATFGLVLVLALVFPVELGGPASGLLAGAGRVDPVFRPFTGIVGLLDVSSSRIWGSVTALSLVFGMLTVLLFLPWLDGGERTSTRRRQFVVFAGVAIISVFLGFILFGGAQS